MKKLDVSVFSKDLVREADSDSGTWTLKTIRFIQKFKFFFGEGKEKELFKEINMHITFYSKPVTLYKYAQLFVLMHKTDFPSFKHNYVIISRKFKLMLESLIDDPQIQAAKTLIEDIPIRKKSEFANSGFEKSSSASVFKNTLVKPKSTEISPSFTILAV